MLGIVLFPIVLLIGISGGVRWGDKITRRFFHEHRLAPKRPVDAWVRWDVRVPVVEPSRAPGDPTPDEADA
jgi:hypothetical protein